MISGHPGGRAHLYGRLGMFVGLLALLISLCVLPAQAQVPAYASTVGGSLYLLDLSTGSTTLIGNTGVDLLEGLALSPGGSLFGTDVNGNLYSINPLTAATTLIGNTGRGDIEGLDFNGNTLLGITFENQPTVFSINTANASTTTVVTASSPTGLVRALSAADSSNVLIRTDVPVMETLQNLNLTTGTTTIRGTIASADVVSGLDFAADGNFYGVNFGGQILRINPANAATVVIANTNLRFLDLTATSSAVPEPGSLALFAGVAIAGVGFMRRRRR